MKKTISLVLMLCMVVSLFAGLPVFAAESGKTEVLTVDFSKAKNGADGFNMIADHFVAGGYSDLMASEVPIGNGAMNFAWPGLAQMVSINEYSSLKWTMDINVKPGQWCGVGLRGDKDMTHIPDYGGGVAIGQGVTMDGQNIEGSTSGIMLMLHSFDGQYNDNFTVCFRTNDSSEVAFVPFETSAFRTGQFVTLEIEDKGDVINVRADGIFLTKIEIDTSVKNEKGNYYKVAVKSPTGRVIQKFDDPEINIPERGVAGVYARACDPSIKSMTFEYEADDVTTTVQTYEPASAFQKFSYDNEETNKNVALTRMTIVDGRGWKTRDKGAIGFMQLDFEQGGHYMKFVSNHENNGLLSANYKVYVDSMDTEPVASGTAPGGRGSTFYAKGDIPEGIHNVYVVFEGVQSGQNRYPTIESVEFFKERPYGFHLMPVEPEHDAPRDLYSDTWSGIDDLGRVMPMASDDPSIDAPREGKSVGIFYYICHDEERPMILDPCEMINDAGGALPNFMPYAGIISFYSGRPKFGYYVTSDEWLIRKHAQMLTDIGVDVIFFDTTNQVIYENTILTLLDVYEKIRSEGGKTPQIAFMGPDGAGAAVHIQSLYNVIYKEGRYKDLWYYWDGKPLVLLNFDYVTDPECKEFFTFRKCWAWETGSYRWTWLPINNGDTGMYGWGADPNVVECATVNAAEHASTNMGKSMVARGAEPGYTKPYGLDLLENGTSGLGKYYERQWSYALGNDPKLIFITQWNEFNGGFFAGANYVNPRRDVNGEGTFIDIGTPEFSRDLEPLDDYYHDNYYYQTAQNIRYYKGARKTFTASAPVTIDVNGSFAQWDSVGPEFRDTLNDTAHRDWRGGADDLWYTNKTGRNDIAIAKVARDAENVYFYVATQGPITKANGDDNWMVLYLNSDGYLDSGWQGYDYIIRPGIGEIQMYNGNGYDFEKVGNVTYTTAGRELMLAVPRALLDMDDVFTIDFKWADNSITEDDVYSFMDTGDVAPNARFNFRYTEDATDTEAQVLDAYVFDRNDLSTQLASPKTREAVILQIDTMAAVADNKADVLDVAPQIVDDRTVVPIRFISEAFGAEVNWEAATQTVTIVAGEYYKTTVEMQIGNTTMTVNGEEVVLDVAPQIINDRTMIPLRAAVEAIGKQVYWNDQYRLIVIAGEGFDFDSPNEDKNQYWGSGEDVKIGGLQNDAELLAYLDTMLKAYR